MKLQRIAFVFALLLTSSALANNYKIDPSHTYVGFRVKHLGISNVKGRFTKFDGTGTFDEKSGKISNIKMNIESASVDTEQADRDKHLRSADFFDADKFKEIKFESTEIVTKGKKPSVIKGKLTMKGVTKDVTLKVTEWGGTAIDPWGNEKVGFTVTGKVNRQDFGVSWNKPLDKAKGLTVGDDVELTIEIQANKEKVTAKN